MTISTGGVAFFDSGIGGLTVLNSCRKILQNEIVYYYGDNKRAPYGNLPKSIIEQYLIQAFDVFARLKVKVAIIACNTATAVCIQQLREKYPFPIIGTEPAVLPAAKAGGEVFVLCTRRTSESQRLAELCQKAKQLYPSSDVRLIACDGLAGEVETNPFHPQPQLEKFLPIGCPQGVVLGCTHYVYYKKQIAQFYRCSVYDGNDGVCRQLFHLLNKPPNQTLELQEVNKNSLVQTPLESVFQNSKSIKDNKDSLQLSKMDGCSQIKVPFQLFFLGSGQENNKKLCKQMFGLENSGQK